MYSLKEKYQRVKVLIIDTRSMIAGEAFDRYVCMHVVRVLCVFACMDILAHESFAFQKMAVHKYIPLRVYMHVCCSCFMCVCVHAYTCS